MSLNAFILGATGLCGSGFLKVAEKSASFAKITTLTRRELPTQHSAKVVSIVNKDSETWGTLIPDEVNVFFSGLATTRGQAGSQENFYKIDHDMNVDLAKAAKAKGCNTCVIVSSAGANENSRLFYFRVKGEIERDIIALGFDKTIILRPGPLLGDRGQNDKGFLNAASAKIGSYFYRSRLQGLVGHPVYGDEVAKVGVKLATDLTTTKKVQIVESAEILRLAKEQ